MLGFAQTGNPQIFLAVDVLELLPGMGAEFLVYDRIEAPISGAGFFEMNDRRIFVEALSDGKGRHLVADQNDPAGRRNG